jgi:hypothetical protein
MTSELNLPPPPWRLEGDAIVAFTAAPQAERGRLPAGARALPGPGLVFAISYSSSPVGPYLETVVCIPAWYLGRPGFCVTTIAVDSEPALWAGLDFWGYPKVLGTMEWDSDGPVRELRWKERDLVVRAKGAARAVPAATIVPTVQALPDGGGAFTGLRIVGRLAPARIEIEAPEAGPLAGLAGRHRGSVASGMRMSVPRPALLGSASPHTAAALAGEVPLPAYRPEQIGTRLA